MFPTPCSHFTSYFTNSKFKILSTIIDSLQSRYYKSIWITLYMENLNFFLNKHCCNDFTYRFNQSFKSERFYIFFILPSDFLRFALWKRKDQTLWRRSTAAAAHLGKEAVVSSPTKNSHGADANKKKLER